MARKKSGNSQYKTRNWVTVMYPESAPENWRDTLRSWCVQAFVSPLHDQDKDPDGNIKKAHWHVLMMWDGPKSGELMEKRVAELGGVGCQPCNSARGYARYLCHLDNPEKYQYDMGDVEEFGGADYMEVIALASDRRKAIAEMVRWCEDTGCTSFRELSLYAMENRDDWWNSLTANSTMYMFRFLRSKENDLKRQAVKVPAVPDGDKPVKPVEPVDEVAVARAAVRNLEAELLAARARLAAVEESMLSSKKY